MNSTSFKAMTPHLTTGNFYGETVRQFHAGGFSLSETRYLPGTSLPRHSHESHYFGLVLKGSYHESFDRKLRLCEPSIVLFHPAGEVHAQSFDTTAVHLFRIEVNPARLGYQIHPHPWLAAGDFRGGVAVSLAQRLYREFEEPDEVSHLAVEGLGLELIAAIARETERSENSSSKPPRWLRLAHELIKSRYLERLSLSEIADAVGVHPVTLAREFRNQHGCTVGEMVRRERIAFACQELVARKASFADIAAAAGFYDQSHFARTFKKLTGITPGEYRRHGRPR